MSGIYIHIPFCRKACIYCNFHFSTSLLKKEDMVKAIMQEAALRKNELQQPIQTVYFGGGTPSLLEPGQLDSMLNTLYSHFSILPDAEITLEANPDDMTINNLKCWRQSGINRLSVGIQSFDEKELKWMNRSHSAEAALRCLEDMRTAGFDNFSADLIFGSQVSGFTSVKSNLEKLIYLETPHISCYGMTVETGTPLFKMIRRNKTTDTDDRAQADQFLYIMERLGESGYEHYEISNYARPGFESRHNSSYWKGLPYLGLGPSAHSFNGDNIRYANVSNNNEYMRLMNEGLMAGKEESLLDRDIMNEFIMIRLRLQAGMDANAFLHRFGEIHHQQLMNRVEKYLRTALLEKAGDHIRLTTSGKLMADGIAADLFF